MKRLYAACAICILLSFSGTAQVPVNQHPVEKPALFAALPGKFSCSINALQSLFGSAANGRVNLQLSNQLQLNGIVLEKVAVSNQQVSINIRCNNYQNALLNISRITLDNGNYKYVGRLVSPAHGDVLLLWEDKGQYYFIKQKQLLSMVE
jgi:hypothetical protein